MDRPVRWNKSKEVPDAAVVFDKSEKQASTYATRSAGRLRIVYDISEGWISHRTNDGPSQEGSQSKRVDDNL